MFLVIRIIDHMYVMLGAATVNGSR